MCRYTLDGEVLHGLDQAALDVAGAGRLHRRVDQPLTAAHGVEEELLGRQPPQVGVLDEASRLGAIVILLQCRRRQPVPAAGMSNAKASQGGKQLGVARTLVKCGNVRSENPNGIRFPSTFCCPTHAIICEMLMKEPCVYT